METEKIFFDFEKKILGVKISARLYEGKFGYNYYMIVGIDSISFAFYYLPSHDSCLL